MELGTDGIKQAIGSAFSHYRMATQPGQFIGRTAPIVGLQCVEFNDAVGVELMRQGPGPLIELGITGHLAHHKTRNVLT